MLSDHTDPEACNVNQEQSPPIVAFIGADAPLKRLLQLLVSLEASSGRAPLALAAVVDANPDAPAAEMAGQLGAVLLTDPRELSGFPGLELVVDLSGDPSETEKLRPLLPPGVSLMDARASSAVWRVLTELQARLDRARREAHAQRMAVVAEMSKYFAHEIRNPLMSIGGFAQSLIAMDGLKDEQCRRRAQVIVDEARRLEQVLHKIYDLTRPLNLNRREADLNAVVREAVNAFEPDLKRNEINLDVSLDQDSLKTLFDPVLIKQVCLSLIQNALEAMPQGGQLRIVTRRDWDSLSLLCRDNGPGIAPELKEQVFNPFFTTKEHALGLGLAMTKKIIEDHDGVILLTSQPGSGTQIEFKLPVERRQT